MDKQLDDLYSFIVDNTPFVFLFSIVLFLAFTSIYVVEPGFRGIIYRSGEFKSISGPGIHVKFSIFDSVVPVSISSQKIIDSYFLLSKDKQSIRAKIVVNYALNPLRLREIFLKYYLAYEQRALKPQILIVLKSRVGQFTFDEIIKGGDGFNDMILEELQGVFNSQGFDIESIQIKY